MGALRTAGAIAATLVGAAVLSACGTAGPPGADQPPSGTSPPSSSAPPSGNPSAHWLRGVRVAKIDCHAVVSQPQGGPVVRIDAVPVRIVICPLQMPNASGPPTDLRPAPADLVAALSTPDTPKPIGQYACAAYADVPQVLYAELPDGQVYWLWIPMDACSHYLPEVLTVVNRYAHHGIVVG